IMAFCSAWSVRWQLSRPSTIRMRHPTSSQWGIPEGLPLYPVVRIRLSRTITAPTASRGHVERVATSCAMRMKYSSQDGRVRLSAVSTSTLSKGSIQSVSCVAEARHDEGGIVQLRVDGGGVEVHVGVFPGETLDARHGGDGVEAGDPGRPFVFQLRKGRREATPGREHRVQDEHQKLLEVPREVHVVLDGLCGLLVAEEAHEADGGLRQQSEGAVEHPETGAQDGNEADGSGDLLHLGLRERGPYSHRTGGHVAGRLGDHDERELFECLAELRRAGALVAQDGELVPAQRAVDDAEVLRLRLRLTHRVGKPR